MLYVTKSSSQFFYPKKVESKGDHEELLSECSEVGIGSGGYHSGNCEKRITPFLAAFLHLFRDIWLSAGSVKRCTTLVK
jgi:hypothetical protein